MIRHLVSLAAITFADLPGPQDRALEPPPVAIPDRISYAGTGNGWTGGRTEWWIDRSGRGAYRTTIRYERSGKFNAGPGGFEHVRAMLQPLEDVHELPCDGAVTDQGMGTLTWARDQRETTLRFDFGCNFRQPDAARTRLFDATALVQEWALAK